MAGTFAKDESGETCKIKSMGNSTGKKVKEIAVEGTEEMMLKILQRKETKVKKESNKLIS